MWCLKERGGEGYGAAYIGLLCWKLGDKDSHIWLPAHLFLGIIFLYLIVQVLGAKAPIFGAASLSLPCVYTIVYHFGVSFVMLPILEKSPTLSLCKAYFK